MAAVVKEVDDHDDGRSDDENGVTDDRDDGCIMKNKTTISHRSPEVRAVAILPKPRVAAGEDEREVVVRPCDEKDDAADRNHAATDHRAPHVARMLLCW